MNRLNTHLAAATVSMLVAGASVLSAAPALAHNRVQWSVTVGTPGIPVYTPPPYVIAPPPQQFIYGPPPSAFAPPPAVIYVQPQPVYKVYPPPVQQFNPYNPYAQPYYPPRPHRDHRDYRDHDRRHHWDDRYDDHSGRFRR